MSSRDVLTGAKSRLEDILAALEESPVPLGLVHKYTLQALRCVENGLAEDDAKRLAETDRRRTSRSCPPDNPRTNSPRRATARTSENGLGGGVGGDLSQDLSGSLGGQSSRGTRAPSSTDEKAGEWCMTHGVPEPTPGSDAAEFLDYWSSVPGSKGRKVLWDATWRANVKRLAERRHSSTQRFIRPLAPGDELSEAEKAVAARKAAVNGR